MIILIKLGKVRAISIEWNRMFGARPFFKKTSYRCETIVDMPYTQAILTSGTWTPLRRAANDQQKITKTSDNLERVDRH
jgi:hypothetical protein